MQFFRPRLFTLSILILGAPFGVPFRSAAQAPVTGLNPTIKQIVDQIAQVLSVPRGTVESRLFRAREQMRQKLKGYGS